MRRVHRDRPELVAQVLEEVRERGPVAASEVLEHEKPERTGPWWDWSDVKRAFEFLFWSGRISSARRRGFERLYDLPERVLPAEVIRTPTPPLEEAQRELVRIAARSLGVAAERDLRDYFRLGAVEARERVAELVEAGDLLPVEVEGWRGPAYLDPAARLPRRVSSARAGRAVRLADLGARARRAAVRLPLPDRDLRARAQARARLLRAAVPARRPARGAGRPQGRPAGRGAARAGGVRGAGRAGGDGARSCARSWSRWRAGSGSSGST